MNIHWHKRAAASLHRIEKYILQEFGEQERQDFIDEIDRSITALADMPTLGKIDSLLTERRFFLKYGLVMALKHNWHD